MRVKFDASKSAAIRANPKRGIGDPEQYRAIGWVNGSLFSIIFDIRTDAEGDYFHLITLWKATKEEQALYARHT